MRSEGGTETGGIAGTMTIGTETVITAIIDIDLGRSPDPVIETAADRGLPRAPGVDMPEATIEDADGWAAATRRLSAGAIRTAGWTERTTISDIDVIE